MKGNYNLINLCKMELPIEIWTYILSFIDDIFDLFHLKIVNRMLNAILINTDTKKVGRHYALYYASRRGYKNLIKFNTN